MHRLLQAGALPSSIKSWEDLKAICQSIFNFTKRGCFKVNLGYPSTIYLFMMLSRGQLPNMRRWVPAGQ